MEVRKKSVFSASFDRGHFQRDLFSFEKKVKYK